ncbi:hypothetical protein HFD88_009183 [Aspergillus terreus]|nr:hypothetical protein HFD88_009183 [Aspergillus terreus]
MGLCFSLPGRRRMGPRMGMGAAADMAWGRWVVTDMEDTTAEWEWVWAEDMAEGDTEEDMEDVVEDMEGAMDGGGSR